MEFSVFLQYKKVKGQIYLVWFMVFNTIFNNISVISWRSILFVDENGIPRENHRPVTNH
jgi:hypothetical protein